MISECCGAKMNGHDIDYQMCPDCKEHCNAIEEPKQDKKIILVYPGINESFTGKVVELEDIIVVYINELPDRFKNE